MKMLITLMLSLTSAANASDIRVARAGYNSSLKEFKSNKSLASIKVVMNENSLKKGNDYADFSNFCISALNAVKLANSNLDFKVSQYVTKIECNDSAKSGEKKYEMKNKTLIFRNQGDWPEFKSSPKLSEEVWIFLEKIINPKVGTQ